MLFLLLGLLLFAIEIYLLKYILSLCVLGLSIFPNKITLFDLNLFNAYKIVIITAINQEDCYYDLSN